MASLLLQEIALLENAISLPVANDGVDTWLQTLVDSVVRLTDANRATLILFDWNEKKVSHFLRGGEGWDAVMTTVGFEELGAGLSGWALRNGKVVLSSKSDPDPREGPEAQKRRLETGCGSIMVAPLGTPGAWLGTITAINRLDQPDFSPDDAKNLLLFASFAAMAVRYGLNQAALEASRTETALAVRSKLNFLSNLSHELRTPLNGILGFSQLLEATKLDPQQSNMVQTIVQSGHRLLGTVDNVLELAQFEAGQFRLENSPFSPHSVLEVVLSKYSGEATEKNLAWKVEVSPELPAVLVGDSVRLGQAWGHLLSNAVKFTDKGSVTTQLEARSLADGRFELALVVRDTGIGLSTDRSGHWFMPFHQEDGSLTRRFGGTGLGLTLCDRIVRQMSGGLSLLGEPGIGTSARVWVVLCPEGLEVPGSANTVRVLLQDADPVGRLVLAKLLEKEGHRVDVVATPEEADRRLESVRYEILVTDGSHLDVLRTSHLQEIIKNTGIRMIGVFPMDTPAQATQSPLWTATITKPASSLALQRALKLSTPGGSR